MPLAQTALRAGTAAIALAGFCGIAAAQTSPTHVLTVALPGGGVAQVRYAGDVAPQIAVSDSPAASFAALPSLFATSSPFVEMERISAVMDRQAARLFQEAAALSAQPAQLDLASLGALPAGAREYQFVSTMSGNGVCSRSIEITGQGNGAAPQIVSHTSGDCGAAGGFRVPTEQQRAPIPSQGPQMIMTKATGTHPSSGRIEEAALR